MINAISNFARKFWWRADENFNFEHYLKSNVSPSFLKSEKGIDQKGKFEYCGIQQILCVI